MVLSPKDLSGWSFSAGQGVNTSHEDSAAYTGSTFSSRMETEVVTHALRWFAPRQSDHTCHHPHRFNELAATKSEM